MRSRVRVLSLLFVVGFIGGYPLAGDVLEWMIAQPRLIPDETTIIILQPLELVLLRLQIAGYLGITLVVMTLIWDAARLAGSAEIPDDLELPQLPKGALFRGFIALCLSFGLAVLGLIYAWEVLIPFLLEYLQQDASAAGLETTWNLQAWIGFLLSLALGSALAFQVPLVVLVILRGNLVERSMLTHYRRHLWFTSVVAGAVISPPDPLSLGLIAAPMILLFEVALLIDAISPRK
ncbi:MAG: twin-arginine translocase subunit TatC [Candidatus Thermoplasmatota archaeon]|nr:twin-arginine translocase subunit TatC [Candidatus Thermoplasmatota archaeon]